MSENFGSIAIKNTQIEKIKLLCTEWERQGHLFRYVIAKGPEEWSTLIDSNLEWGNTDFFSGELSEQLDSMVFSVEYFRNEMLRLCLWDRGYKTTTIIYGEPDERIKQVDEKKLAEKLGVSYAHMKKIHSAEGMEEKLNLLECLLQCQLWGAGVCGKEKEKEIAAFFPPIEYLKKFKKRKKIPKKTGSASFEISLRDRMEGIIKGIRESYIVLDEGKETLCLYRISIDGYFEKQMSLAGWDDNSNMYFTAYEGEGLTVVSSQPVSRAIIPRSRIDIYEGNRPLKTIFPTADIGDRIGRIYTLNQDQIYFNLTCCNVRTGTTDWKAVIPDSIKPTAQEWDKFEVWPDGDFLVQVFTEEGIHFIELDKRGVCTNKLTIPQYSPHEFTYWNIEKELLYLCWDPQTKSSHEYVTIYDRNLQELDSYELDGTLISHKLVFEPSGESFYGEGYDFIVQVNRKERWQKVYKDICIGKKFTIIGMLDDDRMAVAKGRSLWILNTKKDMECIQKKQLKGEPRELWTLPNNRNLLLTVSYGTDKTWVGEQTQLDAVYLYEIKSLI